jgi:hypothetical protein
VIFFSVFGFVAVVPGNPETQTVSHSFPKVCAALQRKFGTDAAYRAGRRYVFGLVSRQRITTNGAVFVLLRRRRFPNRKVAGLFVDLRHRN